MWQTRFGQCIYQSPSGYQVFQNYLYRWLTLGSPALQTVLNRYYPHKPVLHYISTLTFMAQAYPNSCCMFGLGGAAVAHLLNHMQPQSRIVAVESSEEVINIAKKYFYLDKLSNLSLVHADALEFLQTSDHQYGHLLVDLYDAHHFPKALASGNFFALCKNKLLEDGIVAFNLANMYEQRSLVHLIQSQFHACIVIPVKKCANLLVIASKYDDRKWLMSRVENTGYLKNISWTESWGMVGETR